MARLGFIAEKFAKYGYDFYAMDHRGHGESGGKTMYVPSMEIMTSDVKGYIELVIESFYGKNNGFETHPSIYLVAHSMGSMITLRYLCENGPKIGEKATIQAVAFLNPFWDVKNKKLFQALAWGEMKKKQYTKDYENTYAPEVPINLKMVPKHMYHWTYDFDNRI